MNFDNIAFVQIGGEFSLGLDNNFSPVWLLLDIYMIFMYIFWWLCLWHNCKILHILALMVWIYISLYFAVDLPLTTTKWWWKKLYIRKGLKSLFFLDLPATECLSDRSCFISILGGGLLVTSILHVQTTKVHIIQCYKFTLLHSGTYLIILTSQ